MSLTRNDLQAIRSLVKDEVEASEKRTESKMIQFKDEILNEVKGLRQEVTIVVGYKDQIEEHEDRLNTVDKHLNINSIPQN